MTEPRCTFDKTSRPLAARHARVDQVALYHRIVLGTERDRDSWVFGTLALVDGGRVGKHQLVELRR